MEITTSARPAQPARADASHSFALSTLALAVMAAIAAVGACLATRRVPKFA
jgi:hypothetical protein